MSRVSKYLFRVLVMASLLMAMFTIQPKAGNVTSGNWIYEKNSTGVTVKGTTQTFTSSGSWMNIPQTIDGYTVNAIGSGAFCRGQFWFVSMPDSIKTIDNGAFADCTNLRSVTIPKNVTSLGYSVFINCNNLSSITIYGNPNMCSSALGTSRKTVRTYRSSSRVISFCNSYSSYLTLQYLDAAPAEDTTPTVFTYADSYGTWTFDRTSSAITKYSGTAISVTVPTSVKYEGKSYKVKKLGSKAFNGNNSITYLYMDTPEVGSNAVYKCNNLKSITLGYNVMFLDSYCFWESKNVTSIQVYGNPITTTSIFYPNTGLNVNCSRFSLYVRYYCYNYNIRDCFGDIHLANNVGDSAGFSATIFHGYGGLSDTVYFAITSAVGTQGQWDFWNSKPTNGNSGSNTSSGSSSPSHVNNEPVITSGDKYLAKMLYDIYKGWVKEKYPTTYQNYYTPDYVYFQVGAVSKWW